MSHSSAPGPPATRTATIDRAEDNVAGLIVTRRRVLSWIVGVAVFAAAYGLLLLVLHRTGVEDRAIALGERAGVWGALILFGLMILAVMSPLPDSPIALACFLTYGPYVGCALVVGGSWTGAMADFFLVRALGREAFIRRFPRVAGAIDALAERLGFTLLVLVRMIPTVTFDLLSYAAAVTRIPTQRFALATFLGLLPGPLIAAAVGGGVSGGSARVSAGLTILAVVVVAVVLWRARRILH